jgi:peptidoglycan hydrolase CwlO-like protein
MTELEKTLLDAFEALSTEHEKQVSELQRSQASLYQMFERTSQENTQLQKQVEHLSNQVTSLSGKLRELSELYSKNKR